MAIENGRNRRLVISLLMQIKHVLYTTLWREYHKDNFCPILDMLLILVAEQRMLFMKFLLSRILIYVQLCLPDLSPIFRYLQLLFLPNLSLDFRYF
jgi:hypothetical protein